MNDCLHGSQECRMNEEDRFGVLNLSDTLPLVGWLVDGWAQPALTFQSWPVHGGRWPQAVVSTLTTPWHHWGAFKPLKPGFQSQKLKSSWWNGAWAENLPRGLQCANPQLFTLKCTEQALGVLVKTHFPEALVQQVSGGASE